MTELKYTCAARVKLSFVAYRTIYFSDLVFWEHWVLTSVRRRPSQSWLDLFALLIDFKLFIFTNNTFPFFIFDDRYILWTASLFSLQTINILIFSHLSETSQCLSQPRFSKINSIHISEYFHPQSIYFLSGSRFLWICNNYNEKKG